MHKSWYRDEMWTWKPDTHLAIPHKIHESKENKIHESKRKIMNLRLRYMNLRENIKEIKK